MIKKLFLLFLFLSFAHSATKVTVEDFFEKYNGYKNYIQLTKELGEVTKKISKIRESLKKDKLDVNDTFLLQGVVGSEFYTLIKTEEDIRQKLSLISDYEHGPFGSLTKIDFSKIEDKNNYTITTPFGIISAYKKIEEIESLKRYYKDIYKLLLTASEKITNKYEINNSSDIIKIINDFNNEKNSFYSNLNMFTKIADEKIETIQNEIYIQYIKLSILLSVIVVSYIVNLIVRQYVSGYINENRRYVVSKNTLIISIITTILVTISLYVKDISNMSTIFAFAGASIVIVLKEVFLNFAGWIYIVFISGIGVGDKVKYVKGDILVYGEIVDIGIMRMTIFETVTQNGLQKGNTIGSFAFIPNLTVFSDIFVTTAHSGIDTIKDTITIIISYDSDLNKAITICKEVLEDFNKNDILTIQKQLDNLKNKYHLKIDEDFFQPEIFVTTANNGIILNITFLTDSLNIMKTKTNLTTHLLERLKNELSIKIIGFNGEKPKVKEEIEVKPYITFMG